jgi:hypothetical protein
LAKSGELRPVLRAMMDAQDFNTLLRQIIADAFEVCSGGGLPADAHGF